MKHITFVSGNNDKVDQLRRMFDGEIKQVKIDIREIQSLSAEEVATHKAQQAYAQLQTPVVIDDTSLVIHKLVSLPGPLIKWFLETIGNQGMLDMLQNGDDRSATATVCIAYCDEHGVQLFKESTLGTIATKERSGPLGVGWDPIFIPAGQDLTWGEMNIEQQNETSIRRRALQRLSEFLEQ